MINHSSPEPSCASNAGESYQSTSTPSNRLSLANAAKSLADCSGSIFEDVGVSVAPKALTISLTPASVKFFFKVSCIFSLVSPKTPAPMKYKGLLHTKAASTAPEEVQNDRQT